MIDPAALSLILLFLIIVWRASSFQFGFLCLLIVPTILVFNVLISDAVVRDIFDCADVSFKQNAEAVCKNVSPEFAAMYQIYSLAAVAAIVPWSVATAAYSVWCFLRWKIK